jgi:hypothetical protein
MLAVISFNTINVGQKCVVWAAHKGFTVKIKLADTVVRS